MSIYYFAYGSNLHPFRLKNRIPNAKLISINYLQEYRLLFNKKGQDNSSKCNINFTGNQMDRVYGAIYQVSSDDLKQLDRIEGLDQGYMHQEINLKIDKKPLSALTYLAMPGYLDGLDRPYTWYRDLVIIGMEYLRFHSNYIKPFRTITCKKDQNLLRDEQMSDLLIEMKNMPISAARRKVR